MIRTAIDIIDELGVNGLTVKELAAREGVAQSLIYKHFSSMDEVIAEVVDYFAQFDKAIIDSTINKEIDPKERICVFVRSYIEYYENYPAVASLLNSYESLKAYPSTRKKVEEVTLGRIASLQLLFDKATKSCTPADSFNPHSAAIVVWGYLAHMVLLWRIQNQAFPVKEEVLHTVGNIVECISAHEQKRERRE